MMNYLTERRLLARRAATALLPLVLVVGAVLLAVGVRTQAGPTHLAAATPEPDAVLKQQCIDGAAVGTGNDGLASDCALLLEARDPLRGTATLNWSADTAIASWTGITVMGTPSRVAVVDVSDMGLDGVIPAALGGLTKLGTLALGDNELTGEIPGELGALSELVSLTLSDNSLEGSLPESLLSLSNLGTLDAAENALTGTIPAGLFGLASLSYVDLSDNQLTGSIPPVPEGRANMTGVALDGNQLDGSIPVGLTGISLDLLWLSSNSLTGCIPQGLQDIQFHDLGDLGLPDCTTATTYTLTTSAGPNGSIDPPPGTYRFLDGTAVTVTATADYGHRRSWSGACSGRAETCTVTMDADKTASVTFSQIRHTLLVKQTGDGGTLTPRGRFWYDFGTEVTVTARWNEATHDWSGWGGQACAGVTGSVCVVTMDADKRTGVEFTALPADRCATPDAADCIRAVYIGAPGDYTQVPDIPADKLLTPYSDGRYYVERGQQYTVVTAAPLPEDYTRFWLQRRPMEFGTPSPVHTSQLIRPIGTTYTFTVSEDPDAPTLFRFDLTAARPFVRPRPDGKPELGDVVATTEFSVETTTISYSTYDTTGAAATAGSYAFLSDPADTTTAVTTYEALRDGTATGLVINESDSHGASHANLLDSVEVGDLFESHQQDDCWTGYRVTAVMPDPTGAVPRKLLTIEPYAYAYTGCSGQIRTSAAIAHVWGAPPVRGGSSLTFPVMHGPFQVVPAGWTGAIDHGEWRDPPAYSYDSPVETRTASDAEQLPYWRDLPGWTLVIAHSGGEDDPLYGYCAEFDRDTSDSVVICGGFATRMNAPAESVQIDGSIVEVRVLNGYLAALNYTPPGTGSTRLDPTVIIIYDDDSGATYEMRGHSYSLRGANIDALIDVARLLFPEQQ